MVIPSEFIDPFYDDIVSFPINRTSLNANIVELIIGAVIFLSIVAIYNALFSIWERLLGRGAVPETEPGDLQQQDDVLVRVTYAFLVVFIAFLVVNYLASRRTSRRPA
jgi:hypothetical protein